MIGIKREEERKVPIWAKSLWQERAYGPQGQEEEHCDWSRVREGEHSTLELREEVEPKEGRSP